MTVFQSRLDWESVDLVLLFLRLVQFRTVALCAPRVLNNFCFLGTQSWSYKNLIYRKFLISCSPSGFKSNSLYAILWICRSQGSYPLSLLYSSSQHWFFNCWPFFKCEQTCIFWTEFFPLLGLSLGRGPCRVFIWERWETYFYSSNSVCKKKPQNNWKTNSKKEPQQNKIKWENSL